MAATWLISSIGRARSARLAILVLAVAGAALTASAARAAPGDPADFSLNFEEIRPGAPTDAELYILYKDPADPGNPDGQSPPLTEVIIAAPEGTVFNGRAVAACPASDAELMLLGQAACPEESRVGGGFASVVTTVGPPSEQVAKVSLFNYGDGIIELLEFLGGGLKIVDRASFEGKSTMVLHPAVVPGFTEREFSFSYLGTSDDGEDAFITTPPDCPASGVWTSRLTYTVTTGATYSVSSTAPCVPTPASAPGASGPAPGGRAGRP